VGVPAAKVRTLPEFLEELLVDENMKTPFMEFNQANKVIKTSGLGFALDNGDQIKKTSAPTLGEHTHELLKSIGINEDQIGKMMAANILR
jgi:crotonobetainyl-CoA:carnitine CoA-transferase CaiB-like acyl-CoA transferase